MAIGINFLDAFDVFLQIQQNLRGLQKDMRQNATTWKAMAQAQNPPVGTLRQFMADAGAAYSTRLGWVSTLRNDATKRQRLLDILGKLDIPEQDVIDKAAALSAIATQLQGATLNNYTQITNACDGILSNVEARFNLWPE
jgi:hypothetical protein